MTKLEPSESDLTGIWIVVDGKIRGDSTCERIHWLIAHHLRKVAVSKQSGGWDTLYQDPDDGRFWERTYPQGAMQGGGPPRLGVVNPSEASTKYELS
jgi:hypothetical protein